MIITSLIFVLLMSYLLGSIPSSLWIGKTFYGIDIREFGSKNAGATNTFRVLGYKPGIAVLFLDVLKGIFAIYFVHVYLNNQLFNISNNQFVIYKVIAGIGAFSGHLLPIFASFKGGKGVATSLGVIISIQTNAAIICLIIFVIIYLITNYVSLGAIVSSFCFPFVVKYILNEESIYLIFFSIFISFTIIFAHKSNIVRLIRGEEHKLNLFKK